MANEIMEIEKQASLIASEATDWLLKDIDKGKISCPAGYDLGSEIATAMLKIAQTVDRNQKPALTVCTKASVILAMRDMAIQGLSMVRNQCYPIVYGNKLQIQRSYFGTLVVFERMFPDFKVTANCLYEGDKYSYMIDEFGDFPYITNVESSLENRNKPIVAVYGSIVSKSKRERVFGCVMTKAEIDKSWSKARTKNVQQDFPQEMAKRTLINRMCKLYVNSSAVTDGLLVEAFNRTTQNEYDEEEPRDVTPQAEVDKAQAIRKKSNGVAGLKNLVKAQAEVVETTPPEPNPEPQAVPKAKVEEITTPTPSNASEGVIYNEDTGEVYEEEEDYIENEEIPFF